MKKFITILLVSFCIISCSSDDDNKVRNSEFVGKWNWTGTHGGFNFHIHVTPASEGYTLQLNLMKNYTFSILKNGKQVSAGKYTLTSKESIASEGIVKYIKCDRTDNPEGGYFVIDGIISVYEKNKLSIDDGNADGIGSGFERIE